MEFDQLPPCIERGLSLAVLGWDIASAWFLSPAAWSQFILLMVAYYGAMGLMARKQIQVECSLYYLEHIERKRY